jgi:hypothetical protein
VYEQKTNARGSAIMSILLKAPIKKTDLITKSKHIGTKTSSILLVSSAIFIVVVLFMYAGIAFTEGTMKGYSECRDKIVGFEQKGIYGSPDQFKLALSYCNPK